MEEGINFICFYLWGYGAEFMGFDGVDIIFDFVGLMMVKAVCICVLCKGRVWEGETK